MKRFWVLIWCVFLWMNLLTTQASNLNFKITDDFPSFSNNSFTSQHLSKTLLDQQDSVNQTFKNFLTNYLNPYLSVGIGFDRVLFMPAIGVKSGRFIIQASYLDYNKTERFTLHSTYDFKKAYGTEKGYFRLCMAATYNWQKDAVRPVESYGLLSGFSLYQWNGLTSIHTRMGVATRFSDSRQIQIKKLIPVAALSLNFYLLRNEHSRVEI